MTILVLLKKLPKMKILKIYIIHIYLYKNLYLYKCTDLYKYIYILLFFFLPLLGRWQKHVRRQTVYWVMQPGRWLGGNGQSYFFLYSVHMLKNLQICPRQMYLGFYTNVSPWKSSRREGQFICIWIEPVYESHSGLFLFYTHLESKHLGHCLFSYLIYSLTSMSACPLSK